MAIHGLSGTGAIQAQTVSIVYDELGRLYQYYDSGENGAHGVTCPDIRSQTSGATSMRDL
jgi:hypothetical protein